MRRGAHLVVWLGLSLIGAESIKAVPQEPEKQEKSAEAEKSEKMPQEHKPQAETNTEDEGQDTPVTLPHSFKGLGSRFLFDQKQIWTSPAHLGWQDANWLLPLSGVTAGMFVTDAEMSRHISHNATTVSHYNTVSNASVAALLGGAGAMWLFSYPKHNPHWRETGFLAGEAVVNSFVVVEAMKYPLGRQRPNEGNGNGDFFQGGVSFPSEHAAAAWAAAGVVAHEYPGPLTKIAVYSLATLVDYSRYRARQHFPSDVFVGSIIGNMVAAGIYGQHHNQELGGDTWDSLRSYLREASHNSTANMGTPYVPLDSWIYPALERLAAWGYVRSEMLGMRPWTRLDCARLVVEASDRIQEWGASNVEATRLVDLLAGEFSREVELASGKPNESAEVKSVYVRGTEISGQPVPDIYHNYHFGETILNDYGRPYAEGFNSIVGFSGWATEGTLVAYVQGEYQQAGSSPALPLA